MSESRMLLIDIDARTIDEGRTGVLPALLDPRDLLVVNDAATLPASIPAQLGHEPVEVRLLEGPYHSTTRAVLFGRGDHRTPTEHRPPPPKVAEGDVLSVGRSQLVVASVSALSPRLVTLRWPHERAARFALLYRVGRPIQYSYELAPLALWDVQTSFASRPWAVEMPSAARPLDGAMLLALAQKGVPIARLTEAAGLSATGDSALDAALPLPERYEIPEATVRAIARTRAMGGRVVAVGTSVVRALEDSAHRHGDVKAGVRVAELTLGPHTVPRVVSGLLTGIHVAGESHYQLLGAFADATTLERASERAEAGAYRLHEFGDAALFLPGIAQRARQAA